MCVSAFIPCLIAVALLPNSMLAARLHHGQQSQAGAVQLLRGDLFVTQKCIFQEPMPLNCEEGEALTIVSAWWNRREQGSCVKPERGTGSCHPDATDQVIKECAGQQNCILPTGYTGCPKNPFTFLRVRFRCQGPAQEPTMPPQKPTMPPKQLTKPPKQLDQLILGREAREKVSLVAPSRLSNDECALLSVGAFGGCTVKESRGGHASAPVLAGDNVCQCPFIGFTPKTCDDFFPTSESALVIERTASDVYTDTVFGKEGCDCYKAEEGGSMCDFAVREQKV